MRLTPDSPKAEIAAALADAPLVVVVRSEGRSSSALRATVESALASKRKRVRVAVAFDVPVPTPTREQVKAWVRGEDPVMPGSELAAGLRDLEHRWFLNDQRGWTHAISLHFGASAAAVLECERKKLWRVEPDFVVLTEGEALP